MPNIERCAICHEEHDRAVHCLVPVVERMRDDARDGIEERERLREQLRGAVEALTEAFAVLTDRALDDSLARIRAGLILQTYINAHGGQ
jgi:hypothetical protein